MEAVLLAGFLVGTMHAVEADHVAAVASLATRSRAPGEAVRMGIAWGLGHTVTLFCLGAVVLSLNAVVAPQFAALLELLVGIMLVGLGLGVLRRLLRKRTPYRPHLQAQSDRRRASARIPGQKQTDASRLPRHALAVGLLHGMAGTAALVVLALDNVGSFELALAYLGLFGIGSVAGMALLSLAMAVPMQLAARSLTWAHNGLSAAVGLATIAIGCFAIYTASIQESLLTG